MAAVNSQPQPSAAEGVLKPLRFLLRLPFIVLHLLIGVPLTIATFNRVGRAIPAGGCALDERMLRWWSKTLCRIFGFRIQVTGHLADAPLFVTANHISWLDIPLLHSLGKMSFVAKAEIRRWPVVGWLAALAGTVFHRRGSGDSMKGASDAVIAHLKVGGRSAVFPESRVFPGQTVERYHARLFKAAIETQTPVQPICIRYSRDGRLHLDISFRQNETIVGNFFRVLGERATDAQITILPPIDSSDYDRRGLADTVHRRTLEAYESAAG